MLSECKREYEYGHITRLRNVNMVTHGTACAWQRSFVRVVCACATRRACGWIFAILLPLFCAWGYFFVILLPLSFASVCFFIILRLPLSPDWPVLLSTWNQSLDQKYLLHRDNDLVSNETCKHASAGVIGTKVCETHVCMNTAKSKAIDKPWRVTVIASQRNW